MVCVPDLFWTPRECAACSSCNTAQHSTAETEQAGRGAGQIRLIMYRPAADGPRATAFGSDGA